MQSSRGHEYGVKHILTRFAGPLSKVVQHELDLDFDQSQFLIYFGSVYVQSLRSVDPQMMITQGSYLRIHTKPRRFTRQIDWRSRLISEDENYLVLNKSSGLPCHASVDNLHENVLTQAQTQFGLKLWITHRLDVPTSGVLVFAKSAEAQRDFNRSLQNGEVQKFYEVLSEPWENLRCGLYEHHMLPSPRAPKEVLAAPRPGTQTCQLRVLEVTPCGAFQKTRVQLLTGRTHQIRAQYKFLGSPILGDTSYGASPLPDPPPWEEIALKCQEMRWEEKAWLWLT